MSLRTFIQQMDAQRGGQAEAREALPDAQPAVTPPARAAVEDEVRYGADGGYVPATISLKRIVIDGEQPRGYLPPAVRAQVAQGALTPEAALAALVEAAERGEPLAQGYLRSITELAESMAREGQLAPVGVIEQPDGRYRLLWGERRYWAAWWLRARGAWGEGLACRVRADALDEGALQRMRWQENLAREDVPAVRVAEAVAWARREVAARLGQPEREVGTDAINDELERTCGKRWGRRMIYLCLRVATELEGDLRELAAAWGFSFSDLERLTRVKGEARRALAQAMVKRRMGEAGEASRERARAQRRYGRRVQRWRAWAERLEKTCEAEKLEALARLSEAELRAIEEAVLLAQRAVNAQLDKVRRALWERAK